MSDGVTRYLSTSETATKLRVSKGYLYLLRRGPEGPPFIKCGRRILYDHRDLEKWMLKHKVSKA